MLAICLRHAVVTVVVAAGLLAPAATARAGTHRSDHDEHAGLGAPVYQTRRDVEALVDKDLAQPDMLAAGPWRVFTVLGAESNALHMRQACFNGALDRCRGTATRQLFDLPACVQPVADGGLAAGTWGAGRLGTCGRVAATPDGGLLAVSDIGSADSANNRALSVGGGHADVTLRDDGLIAIVSRSTDAEPLSPFILEPR